MRQLLLSTCAAILIGGSVWAQDMQNPEIETTIQSQIDALMADDFSTAFTYASPNIKMMFRNADNFGMMVRRGYPMVWRPADVDFLELREIEGRLWQKVMIRDQKGVVHVLDYQMIEDEGGWKINGVQKLPSPGVAA